METMKALDEYKHKGYVFKRCRNLFYGYDCLVIMMKPENVKCNELRPGIEDKNFAKFRCNGLQTVAIYDLNCEEFITILKHIPFTDCHTIYEVGKLTEPDEYDEDISEICTNGIHYFLSLEAALSYEQDGTVRHIKHGKINAYDSNGQIYRVTTFLKY
jgi:hypothetical protein